MGRRRRDSADANGPAKRVKAESPPSDSDVSAPTSDEEEFSPVAASTSAPDLKAWTSHTGPLTPTQVDDILEQISSSQSVQPLRSLKVKVKAPDGLLYPPRLLHKELAHYWSLMAKSPTISVRTFAAAFEDFKASEEYLRLYPDYPKDISEKRTSGFSMYKAEVMEKIFAKKRSQLGEGEKLPRDEVMAASGRASASWKALAESAKTDWAIRALESKEANLAKLGKFLDAHPELEALHRPQLRQRAKRLTAERHKLVGAAPLTAEALFVRAKTAHYAAKYGLPPDSAELAAKVAKKFQLLSEERQATWQAKAEESPTPTKRGRGRPTKASATAKATPTKEAANSSPKKEAPSFQAFLEAKGLHYAEKWDLPPNSPQLRGKLQKRWDRMDEEKRRSFV